MDVEEGALDNHTGSRTDNVDAADSRSDRSSQRSLTPSTQRSGLTDGASGTRDDEESKSPIFKRGKVILDPIAEILGQTPPETAPGTEDEILGIVNEVFENVPL